MNKKVPALSIFFPFWNEEKNIERVIKNAILIVVDDGSSDKTLEIAEKIAKTNPNIIVVSHTTNRGYGAALRSGFEKAKYDLIVFTDGDGQFDFSEVINFFKKIEKSDIVIGYRKKRFDNPIRHVLMNLLRVWDFVFFGFLYRDIDCGFKM